MNAEMTYDEILQSIHDDYAKTEFPRCPYCGSKGPMVSDHVIPKSRGGSDGPENRELICWKCNSEKGAMTKEEYVERRFMRALLHFW